MITVFLTGATGFIGRAVTQEILKYLQAEDRLYILVRKPVEYGDSRIVPIAGDLTLLENASSQICTAEYIIHIAAEARLSGGRDYYGMNVAATQSLLNIAKEGHALRRFVFVSSISAMDRSPADLCDTPLTVASPCFPRTEYGTSKRMAEESIVQSNLPYTIFRPGFVYGRGMRNDSHLRKLARIIARGVPLHRCGFPGKISVIHVDDLAAAIAKCLTGETGRNRTYLAETECMPLGDALSLLEKALRGRPSLQVHLPAFKSVFQRLHSKVPLIIAGMFLDYFWMDDPAFRHDFIEAGQQRSFREHVHEITDDV